MSKSAVAILTKISLITSFSTCCLLELNTKNELKARMRMPFIQKNILLSAVGDEKKREEHR
ncbi:CLUMA_CG005223, isoform A [Clunio marinus]|uniref:CLUMA_CG005223, isoform A n=1 Tax=Clunio marinus TaxID=568069 RepID=A0A1J1HU18_9DIPT|nr:CLUMA_CG005223, isoform A [Clunio marinus]